MAYKHFFGLLALAVPQLVSSNSFSLPLIKRTGSGISIPPRWHRHQSGTQVGEINDQNFWFANFTVGAKNDQIMLIDTGSTDVYLNYGAYSPSKSSTDLHENFSITFATVNPDGSGTLTISGPLYDDIVALDQTQLSVSQMTLGAVSENLNPPAFPHDGLVGFGGPNESAINGTSWFQHLCSQGSLDHCRFGLAFKTDDTGVQYFGEVASERFRGLLSVAPLITESNGEPSQWFLSGDIAANGKVVESGANIVTDSGTTVIFGPIAKVKALFDAAGIQSVLHPSTDPNTPSTLDGYYPCANSPQLGFGFPSALDASNASKNRNSTVTHHSTIFNVLPSQLAESSVDGNCTAVIHGTDEFGSGPDAIWLVGQAFFQGRYIDHNVDDSTMGFANLVDY